MLSIDYLMREILYSTGFIPSPTLFDLDPFPTMRHHLMVGTWTPPGAIFTFEFDDESLTLNLIKKTTINHDEPISWMTFDVSIHSTPSSMRG